MKELIKFNLVLRKDKLLDKFNNEIKKEKFKNKKELILKYLSLIFKYYSDNKNIQDIETFNKFLEALEDSNIIKHNEVQTIEINGKTFRFSSILNINYSNIVNNKDIDNLLISLIYDLKLVNKLIEEVNNIMIIKILDRPLTDMSNPYKDFSEKTISILSSLDFC